MSAHVAVQSEAVRPVAVPSGAVDSALGQVRAAVAAELSDRRRITQIEAGSPLAEEDEKRLAESLVWNELDLIARQRATSGETAFDASTEEVILERVLAELFGLGAVEYLLDDETIEDIFINGCDNVIVSRSSGVRERVGRIAETDEALIELLNTWAARLGRTERRFDTANPRLDLKLPGGFRLHAIMEVSPRPMVTIRCPRHSLVTLGDLVGLGSMEQHLAELLATAVRARCNIIVAGGTGAGKTTLLRALIHEIPPEERLVTIEDTSELNLGMFPEAHPNVAELETRDANVEGIGEITMAQLTKECLRMSPDRVLVGEVRGAEALAMLKAMSQGNDGSMCTLHADSCRGVASRVRGYCAEAANQLPMAVIDGFYRTAVDIVVHLHKTPDRRRVVSSVVQVTDEGTEGIKYNDLYVRDGNGRAQFTSLPSGGLVDRLVAAGLDVERMAWHLDRPAVAVAPGVSR